MTRRAIAFALHAALATAFLAVPAHSQGSAGVTSISNYPQDNEDPIIVSCNQMAAPDGPRVITAACPAAYASNWASGLVSYQSVRPFVGGYASANTASYPGGVVTSMAEFGFSTSVYLHGLIANPGERLRWTLEGGFLLSSSGAGAALIYGSYGNQFSQFSMQQGPGNSIVFSGGPTYVQGELGAELTEAGLTFVTEVSSAHFSAQAIASGAPSDGAAFAGFEYSLRRIEWIDASDEVLRTANFNNDGSAYFENPNEAPEPASIVLFGTGAVAILCARRRRALGAATTTTS